MKKILNSLLILTVLALIAASTVSVSAAASYKGKGSKSSPYIVETAEQLDGIRNNLKAYYKLGNTIDMSGIPDFKPIGSLSSPFQGSLICDNDASGKPLYAIKNLKITVAPAGCTKAEGFSGYKEKQSGWEAGLFGCASGSSFKNILILDASVTSKVEGCYQMNGDYTVNPGTDEQATGILLAIGKKVTISGCGVSGTVTSASNHVGGLVGSIENSKVSKSYSYANVTSSGSWSTGGFAGTLLKSTITTSFYSGTFAGGQTHAGAFAGDVYDDGIKVSDCWAEGTVTTEDSGCFLGTKNHSDGTDISNTDIASNCYTLAKIAGRLNAQTNKKVTNGNYITDEVGGFELGFAAASQQEMNAAFKSLKNWTVTDGAYPQIKGLVATKDAAAYVPGTAAEENTDNKTETTESGVEADTESTVSGSEAGIEVKTVFDNTLTLLKGPELVLIIVLGALVVLTLAAAIVVFIITIRRFNKKSTLNEDEYVETKTESNL